MYLWKSTILLSKFQRFIEIIWQGYVDKEPWKFREILGQFFSCFLNQLLERFMKDLSKIYESSKKFFQHLEILPTSFLSTTKKPQNSKTRTNKINHVQAIIYADTYYNITTGNRRGIFHWTFITLYSCYFGCPLPIILILKYEWAHHQSYVRLCREL